MQRKDSSSLFSQELLCSLGNLESRCGCRPGEISKVGFPAGESHRQFTAAGDEGQERRWTEKVQLGAHGDHFGARW